MSAPGRAVASTPVESDIDLDAVDRAARALVEESSRAIKPIALAVSGGCDSMVMMHAVARASASVGRRDRPARRHVVTFDHGTGPYARDAAALVAKEGAKLGFHVHVGTGSLAGATEADWRAARWRFFREASPRGAIIATAHTRDDQLETVVMRAMRDAGARGLAGLAAPAPDVARPFLHVTRETIRRYGNVRRVPFVEDPSNTSRDHLRNRIRLDLLPAIARVRPRFAHEMLAIAERAADWRAAIDMVAMRFVSGEAEDGVIRVAREELATYDSAALCVLWPAIAARALVTLDRRGTLRLAQFTTSGALGARMQLSGGVEVFRHRDSFVVRRSVPRPATNAELPLEGVVQLGGWRFRPVDSPTDRATRLGNGTTDPGRRVNHDDPWVTSLPADRPLSVREWRPADRMRAREGGAARRVKRFFGDAHIPGPSRAGWPVVLADGEIVWIPGVRRSGAASERSGRPVVRYACERFDGGLSNG